MKALNPSQADHPIELRDRALVAFGLSDVVAGGEQMAGIQTDGDPFLVPNPVQNLAQVLKAPPQVAALSSGNLQAELQAKTRGARIHLLDPGAVSPQPAPWVPFPSPL